MKNPNYTQSNPSEQSPKINKWGYSILNSLLFLIKITYLFSVYHIFSENIEYIIYFFQFNYIDLASLADALIVINEYQPRVFVNIHIVKFLIKFPKYNFIIYVLFSSSALINFPAFSISTCCIAILEELCIGFILNKFKKDKKEGFSGSIFLYNKIIELIKSV